MGLDVGGTFTDVFLADGATGETVRHKLSSTPENPDLAPVQGIREILALAGRGAEEVGFIGLGTTVATNALLERRLARTGLITTEGFRDLLEIGRQRRPHVYDLFARRPLPLAPRELRFEVRERMAADGSVLLPLDEEGLRAAVAGLRAAGCESVAVCFLHAYANPAHERRAAEILRAEWPEVALTVATDLLPEFREYERLSSTVVNAALMPVMRRYLARFRAAVAELGVTVPPWVMTSGGGVFSTELAAERPLDTLLSGPSGGVSATLHLGRAAGFANLVTFDMGGTSTDVCLIRAMRPEVTQTRQIDGLPIRSAAVDVHTVGAGGSSMAWVDAGGLLRVGPRSAGAKPGPACYRQGGTEPTVTDANVVLGRLNPTHLLAGRLAIDAAASAGAIGRVVAGPKGLGVEDAAAAIIAISNTNIAQAIRYVSVERGLDPGDFVLVAFGGAGPLHAAEVAQELGMRVLVPTSPGLLCAMGVLTKDVQVDLSQTRLIRDGEAGGGEAAAAILAGLAERARAILARSGQETGQLAFEQLVDARYQGQNFELQIPLPGMPAPNAIIPAVREGFDAEHRRLYGYDQPDKPIELVTFRLRAMLPTGQAEAVAPSRARRDGPPRPIGERRAHFPQTGFAATPVFARDDLQPGDVLQGPLLVEQMDTTTIVPPGFRCTVDAQFNLLLDIETPGGNA
ncbi:hydantoinase/oxoprolinase family protein [Roseococcus sp. SYP-B2431]|uniref:hydantoinase/oxoprolinase family protein n=1 Tax=Roseococcus sp. SYP-B2431 TaxID=2496640 RepID=UPI001F110A24|nr:hydantoinase/oxoprolinase family protein [Roseococcus sp. SYP-B2431]